MGECPEAPVGGGAIPVDISVGEIAIRIGGGACPVRGGGKEE